MMFSTAISDYIAELNEHLKLSRSRMVSHNPPQVVHTVSRISYGVATIGTKQIVEARLIGGPRYPSGNEHELGDVGVVLRKDVGEALRFESGDGGEGVAKNTRPNQPRSGDVYTSSDATDRITAVSSNSTVAMLRADLKERGLVSTGTKQVLLRRLAEREFPGMPPASTFSISA